MDHGALLQFVKKFCTKEVQEESTKYTAHLVPHKDGSRIDAEVNDCHVRASLKNGDWEINCTCSSWHSHSGLCVHACAAFLATANLCAPNLHPQAQYHTIGRMLTERQQKVLDVITNGSAGKLIFLTGAAGTGKTQVVRCLAQRGATVTSSTNFAAKHIAGQTIHSFAGYRTDGTFAESAWKRWREAKALVIDEISMISAEFLDDLNLSAQHARGNSKPFGDLSVVFVGDFYQLGPIEGRWAFESDVWQHVECTLELTHNLRTNTDERWCRFLSNLRKGILDHEGLEMLREREEEKLMSESPWIVSTNKEAARINERELKKLPGAHIQYPDGLTLKAGAPVIFTKSLRTAEPPVVKGTLGTVVGFTRVEPTSVPCGVALLTKQHFVPKVRIKDEDRTVIAYPSDEWHFRLAWAATVHRSQGMTLGHHVRIDLRRSFAFGQVYVALSRAKYRTQLSLRGVPKSLDLLPKSFQCDPKVAHFYASLR